jgi:hypothetical protein
MINCKAAPADLLHKFLLVLHVAAPPPELGLAVKICVWEVSNSDNYNSFLWVRKMWLFFWLYIFKILFLVSLCRVSPARPGFWSRAGRNPVKGPGPAGLSARERSCGVILEGHSDHTDVLPSGVVPTNLLL